MGINPMNSRHRTSVKNYTDGSHGLNYSLSRGKELDPEDSRTANELDNISEKIPKQVYSGFGLNRLGLIEDQVGKIGPDSIGKSFSLPGFLSTSVSRRQAQKFGGAGLLEILTKEKGIRVREGETKFDNELESILARNTKLRINSVSDIPHKGSTFSDGAGTTKNEIPFLIPDLNPDGTPIEELGPEFQQTKGTVTIGVQEFAKGGPVGFAEGGGVKGSKKDKSKSKRKYGKIILNSSGSSVSASYADGGPATGEVWAKKSYDSDEDINFFPDDNPDFVPRSATSDPSLYIVASSMATKGYGPRLYDAVMEKVTEKGGKLTSDRSSVSDDAHRVWKHYFTKRPH